MKILGVQTLTIFFLLILLYSLNCSFYGRFDFSIKGILIKPVNLPDNFLYLASSLLDLSLQAFNFRFTLLNFQIYKNPVKNPETFNIFLAEPIPSVSEHVISGILPLSLDVSADHINSLERWLMLILFYKLLAYILDGYPCKLPKTWIPRFIHISAKIIGDKPFSRLSRHPQNIIQHSQIHRFYCFFLIMRRNGPKTLKTSSRGRQILLGLGHRNLHLAKIRLLRFYYFVPFNYLNVYRIYLYLDGK